jgi:hypothetical protein
MSMRWCARVVGAISTNQQDPRCAQILRWLVPTWSIRVSQLDTDARRAGELIGSPRRQIARGAHDR